MTKNGSVLIGIKWPLMDFLAALLVPCERKGLDFFFFFLRQGWKVELLPGEVFSLYRESVHSSWDSRLALATGRHQEETGKACKQCTYRTK